MKLFTTMKNALRNWILVLPVIGLQLITTLPKACGGSDRSRVQEFHHHHSRAKSDFKKAELISPLPLLRKKDETRSVLNSPFFPTSELNPPLNIKPTRRNKKERLVLNENPYKISAFEIPIPKVLPSTDAASKRLLKKPERVKKKSGKVAKRSSLKSSQSPSKPSAISSPKEEPSIKSISTKVKNLFKNLSKISKSTSARQFVEEARTLFLFPLLAAIPLLLAETVTLGGVGMAVPAFILFPILLLPLVVIAFIIFV